MEIWGQSIYLAHALFYIDAAVEGAVVTHTGAPFWPCVWLAVRSDEGGADRLRTLKLRRVAGLVTDRQTNNADHPEIPGLLPVWAHQVRQALELF